MLLATHRVAATTSKDCNRLYIRKKVERATQPGADELAARNRFAAVRALVAARKKDLSHIADDQAAFVAQKDSANGKKTMTAYLWAVCGAAYDEEQNG